MRATNYHMTTVHLSCYHVSVFLVCGFKKIAPCKLDLTIGHWPGSASSVGLVTVAAAFVWWQWSSGDCREEEGYEKKVQHKEAPKFHQGCPCCHVARGTSFFVKYVFVHMFVLLCIFQWFACVHCCISHSTIQFTLFFKPMWVVLTDQSLSQVPPDLPVRRTGRETTPTMPERTIPSSMVFATLSRQLSTKDVYDSTRVQARYVFRKIISHMVASVKGINLMVVNTTDFFVSKETLSHDGCLSGSAVWGSGSQLSNSCKNLWYKELDTGLSFRNMLSLGTPSF